MEITNYWWQIIWMFTIGAFCALILPKREMTVLGKTKLRWSFSAALIMTFPYVLQAAMRKNIYGDTGSYRTAFRALPTALSELVSYVSSVSKDRGFTVFSILVKSVIGNKPVWFFFIVAAILMLCMIYFYRRYSCNLWLSMFVFVAAADYMSWFHNGIRQFLGVGLIMLSIHFLLKKRYLPTIVLILIASTLHGSALLMLPVIFIVQGKPWNKRTLLCILGCVAVLFFVEQFTDILDDLLTNTQYSSMVSDWTEWEDDGTNPIRVLVYSIPMILSLVGYRYIREADDPVVNMMTNFSILTCGVALISMVTSGIFIGRLIVYGSVFSSGVLLPWEINHMFDRRSAQLVAVCAVVCFTAYWYYQMHVTWGLI